MTAPRFYGPSLVLGICTIFLFKKYDEHTSEIKHLQKLHEKNLYLQLKEQIDKNGSKT